MVERNGRAGEGCSPHRVALAQGAPETPSFYFQVGAETLGKLDRGEMSPGTALSGKKSDRLMSVEGIEGCKARIGGHEVEMEGGEAVMIPAGVSHEFWNSFDEPLQGFMLAFGEGA